MASKKSSGKRRRSSSKSWFPKLSFANVAIIAGAGAVGYYAFGGDYITPAVAAAGYRARGVEGALAGGVVGGGVRYATNGLVLGRWGTENPAPAPTTSGVRIRQNRWG